MSTPHADTNLAVRLLSQAADHPDRIALRQGDLAISYADLDRSVQYVGALLRRAGVESGQRVALLFPNDHRFISVLLAVIRIGAVAVPLNTRAGVASLRHVMADATPAVLVAHPDLAESARDLAAVAETPVLTADDDWVTAQLPPDADGSAQPVDPEDVCLQPYTSGSTGQPKGCLLTHGGQYWNASTVADVWELGDDDRGLITAPIYHKNAMICVVKPLLLVGGTIVIGESPHPAGIPAEVERHACTYTTGVPATYELLLASGEHANHDLSSLRFAICGSAPLSDELGRRFSAGLGVPVIEAYGLTEGGPQVLMAPRKGEPRYGRAGRPLPGCQVRLLDIEEMPAAGVADVPEVPVGSVGEMWVRNPGVTVGYYRLPDVTRSRISSDGWLRTGDLAIADPDGWYRVLGRADDMMNVGGENVYPIEVEKLLLSLPGVRQVAVVPVPHPRKGHVPVAFVKAEGDLTEDQVKAYALSQGAPHAHPRRVWFVDELPVGGTGKTDRGLLINLATERMNRTESTT